MSPGAPFSVLVHPYTSPTSNSCAYEIGDTKSKNAVVFIAGLGDGPHSSSLTLNIAKQLAESPELSYSLFEFRMRSSYSGFGTSSLTNDVEDVSSLVEYLRIIGKEKIVLFGHSTGCQDCIEYSDYAKHGNLPVDGFVLLSPVSDRESLHAFVPDFQEIVDYASKMIAEGKEHDCLPSDIVPAMFGAPVTAYRVQSLGVKGGDDDYFSSDLDDELVAGFWARFQKPVLVLHADEDEYVPKHVNQEEANKKYRSLNPLVSSLSGLVPGSGHSVQQEDGRKWLGDRLVQFLGTLSN